MRPATKKWVAGITLVDSNRMKKPEIAKQWARQSGLSQAEAADRLDRAVHQILAKLRKDGEAPLPGVGKFLRRGGTTVLFEREEGKRGG